jgi:hypothetical protein
VKEGEKEEEEKIEGKGAEVGIKLNVLQNHFTAI